MIIFRSTQIASDGATVLFYGWVIFHLYLFLHLSFYIESQEFTLSPTPTQHYGAHPGFPPLHHCGSLFWQWKIWPLVLLIYFPIFWILLRVTSLLWLPIPAPLGPGPDSLFHLSPDTLFLATPTPLPDNYLLVLRKGKERKRWMGLK